MKKFRRMVRRPFETGGFLLLQRVVPLLPRRAVVTVSRFVGATAILLPISAKKVGMKNLNAVFGSSKTAGEKRQILAGSFTTFTQTMLDVFWFSRNPEQRISTYVEFEESPNKQFFFERKPIVCITAHLGGWEVMGQAAALKGVDVASIAAPVKNKIIDRILTKQRERTGQTIIPQKGGLKQLIARFRRNEKAAFLLDQHTDQAKGGIVVDFLGLPMLVSPAPALLAYRTGTAIMLGFCLIKPEGRYLIQMKKRIIPPLFDKMKNSDAVAHELTQQIEDEISAEIREHPHCWLWSYKHWRHTGNQRYPNRYPVY